MSRARKLAKSQAQEPTRPQPTRSAGTGYFFTGQPRIAVFCALLAAATFGLYSPVMRYSFVVWDDQEYVVANPHISGGLRWSTIRWAFASSYAANWHPLTWLSHALDVQLFALNPAGHHLDSVLIHAINAVVLFLLFNWMTNRTGPSLFVAALFAAHPLNVESVAWVAERKNLLSTLFFFLAIAAYVWYTRKPDWRRYLLLVAAFAAGLMAKPMVITLPFVLLLLDCWPLGRTGTSVSASNGLPRATLSRLVIEKIPLFALSAVSAWITLRAQRAVVRTFAQFPFAVRAENAAVAYAMYLWKMLWPARLAAFYPHPPNLLPMWQVALAVLILVGITVLVVAFRHKGYLLFGWFWFLGTLVPVIGLVQVGEAAMADRYAYLSLIGIFVMVAWGVDDWAEAREIRKAWRAIAALYALTALGWVTSEQMRTWESEYTLWKHALQVTQDNPNAEESLAFALINSKVAITADDLQGFPTAQDRIDAARQHFEAALAIYRQLVQQNQAAYLAGLAQTLTNLGNIAALQRPTDEARQHYEEAVKIYRELAQQNPEMHLPMLAGTLIDLGAMAALQNRLDESRVCYTEALTIYRKLAQENPSRYANDVVRVETNLRELEEKKTFQ